MLARRVAIDPPFTDGLGKSRGKPRPSSDRCVLLGRIAEECACVLVLASSLLGGGRNAVQCRGL